MGHTPIHKRTLLPQWIKSLFCHKSSAASFFSYKTISRHSQKHFRISFLRKHLPLLIPASKHTPKTLATNQEKERERERERAWKIESFAFNEVFFSLIFLFLLSVWFLVKWDGKWEPRKPNIYLFRFELYWLMLLFSVQFWFVLIFQIYFAITSFYHNDEWKFVWSCYVYSTLPLFLVSQLVLVILFGSVHQKFEKN